uniref:pyridoxal 5'-phosphate synthase n=1 Tax=Culicoides sonorensis TaxID=179676 RepID=A0A336M3W0_CULSO
MDKNQISSLCKIENPPPHPMTMFKEYLDEAEHYLKETYGVLNLATANSKGEVLNRTVVLRGHDEDGIIFVTERNSRKYLDIQENNRVAATFLWMYHKKDDPEITTHQIRFTGTATELTPSQIQTFYKSEPIYYKIRSAICECGKPVNWDELKSKHDEVLGNYLDGKETLEKMNGTYTAIHIKAETVDFYHSKGLNVIADRVVYRRDSEGKWNFGHVCA